MKECEKTGLKGQLRQPGESQADIITVVYDYSRNYYVIYHLQQEKVGNRKQIIIKLD